MPQAGNNLLNFALYRRRNLVIIPTKLLILKKILLIGIVLTGIIVISSCDYDDSNDLDVITPVDSTDSKNINRKL